MNSSRTTQKGWKAGIAPDFDAMLAKIRADRAIEAAKTEAERLKKLPMPEPTTEGMYEVRIV